MRKSTSLSASIEEVILGNQATSKNSKGRNKFRAFILVASLLTLASCDKVCRKMIYDIATISNETGRALSVSFCKGQSLGLASVTLGSASGPSSVSVGTREGSEVRGGPTATCNGITDSSRVVSLSLNESSFQEVKLCFEETTNTYSVVELNQACPAGHLEQTSPASCP